MAQHPSDAPVSPAAPTPNTGRIDVHSHLLPGVDDGCRTVDDSLACARRLVAAGYTHSFCTPHVWPGLWQDAGRQIATRVADLQGHLDAAGVPLKLFPGGEMNVRPNMVGSPAEPVVSYGMKGKHLLFDIWADELPPYFAPTVQWLRSKVDTLILAHPERLRAVQNDPGLVRYFKDELGLLLQGNLQCFDDPVGTPTRDLIEQFAEGTEYFMFGTDLHKPETLDVRLRGLERAIELLGDAEVNRLTINHPREILRGVL
jgi:protein-tyrosine phosphatase